jgi:MbtH protein
MSTSILDDETAIFDVVLNHEEQYSIWPAEREVPAGWRKEGSSGTKAECLERIKLLWTDMRPLSLRKRMAEDAGREQKS